MLHRLQTETGLPRNPLIHNMMLVFDLNRAGLDVEYVMKYMSSVKFEER